MDPNLLFWSIFIGALYLVAGICFVECWSGQFNGISHRSLRISARILTLTFWPVVITTAVVLGVIAVIVSMVIDICE